eukprot:6199258-Pleurochrysis_carterae.AAC.2
MRVSIASRGGETPTTSSRRAARARVRRAGRGGGAGQGDAVAQRRGSTAAGRVQAGRKLRQAPKVKAV